MMCSNVVLPQPVGPMIPKNSRSLTSRLTPPSARRLPSPFSNSLVRLWMTIRMPKMALSTAENFVKHFCVPLELFKDFRGGKDRLDPFHQTGMFGRSIDPVGNSAHATDELLSSFGKHEIHEETRRIWMGRFGGNTGGVNISENRIQINPINRRSRRFQRFECLGISR